MPCDVIVVGGGPAGSAAARLLALWGHDVRLFTPAEPAGASLAESLPPSCGKLFDLLDVREAVDEAGFVRSTGNTVWWASETPRVEYFSDRRQGWQIDRTQLAALLQGAATAAGVQIDHARLAQLDTGSALCLDCSGRAGVVARARNWRAYESSLRTVALVGSWRRRDDWPIPDATHTLIESYIDGWAWSVPLASGARHIAVMVDPRSTDLARASRSRDVYLAEIAKTQQFSTLTRGASLEGGPWGWDASMYSSTTYADDRVLLVGDAGSFIDPLSSAGVRKALASAWLGAVATHTALVRPAMQAIAFEFFAARERDMYERLRVLTHRFLADAAAGHSHPFWADRAEPLDETRAADLDGDSLRRDPLVQAAFERIRMASALDVHRGAAVRVEARPAVSGCEIVLEQRLVAPGTDAGVHYICDVDVVKLVELAPAIDDVGALFDTYTRQVAPVALPDFLLVLATAVAKGWLRPIDPSQSPA